jgi:hypothetical protein
VAIEDTRTDRCERAPLSAQLDKLTPAPGPKEVEPLAQPSSFEVRGRRYAPVSHDIDDVLELTIVSSSWRQAERSTCARHGRRRRTTCWR